MEESQEFQILSLPAINILPGKSACLNSFVVMCSNPRVPHFVLASTSLGEFQEELGNRNHFVGVGEGGGDVVVDIYFFNPRDIFFLFLFSPQFPLLARKARKTGQKIQKDKK